MSAAEQQFAGRIRGITPADVDFTLQSTPLEVEAVPATSQNTTVKDTIYHDDIAAYIDHVATVSSADAPEPLSFASSDETVLAVDPASGVVSRVNTGIAGVLASVPLLTKRIDVNVYRSGGNLTRTFVSRVEGSLASYLETVRADRTEGVTPNTTTRNIYLTRNYAAQTCTLNPDCVLADVDMSAYSILNSWDQTNGKHGGTLVSLRHMIVANHYPVGVGHTVPFASHTGTVVARNVTASTQVGTTDVRVCLLDSDVPSSITFAKVLPDDWAARLPTSKIPCFFSNQFKQVFVGYVTLSSGYWSISSYQNGTQTLEPWYTNVIDGDSGSPAFFIINNEMVLIGPTHYYGPAGSSTASINADVNAVMTSLGGGYQLTVTDLTSYPSYA